jgi:hypothetical protein
MFKAAWLAIIGGNPGSWAILALGVLLALGGASGVGAYVMHKMDSADYKALQLADSKAAGVAKDKQIADQKKYADDLKAADKRAADLTEQLAKERRQFAQSLHMALQTEGTTNAPLGVCLATKLPPSVLSKLTR